MAGTLQVGVAYRFKCSCGAVRNIPLLADAELGTQDSFFEDCPCGKHYRLDVQVFDQKIPEEIPAMKAELRKLSEFGVGLRKVQENLPALEKILEPKLREV